MSDNTTTIKEQMAKLQEMISWFEGDDFSLEEAQQRFKEAERLAKDIQVKLTTLKNDVTVLSQSFDADAA